MNKDHTEREESYTGREEYLNTLTGQIRCKMAREEVEEEVRGHIEDQTLAFMSEGMERDEAEALAVRGMGDPVEVGNELDKIHRPRMPWGMIALIIALSVKGYMAYHFLVAKCVDEAGNSVTDQGIRYLFFILSGLAVMVGVCFIDYTRTGVRARELMAVLLVGCTVGLKFSGVMMNGVVRWIGLGAIAVDVLALLMLTVPLYAGILYYYRGSGMSGIIKSVLWPLPGCMIAMMCAGAWMAMVLIAAYLVVFEIAVFKGWFGISRRSAVTAGCTVGAALLIMPLVWMRWFAAPYQQERLSAVFGVGGDMPYYPGAFVRTLLDGGRLLGKNPGLSDTILSPPNPSEVLLAGIAGYYGILAALAVAGVLLFLLLRFLHISLKQRNQLGMLMGTGCAGIFLIQAGMYFVTNTGSAYLASFCPFLSMGASSALVNYVLLGLLLSICRYKNTAPERRPGRMSKAYRAVK